MFGGSTASGHNPNNDIEVTAPPNDSIACLAWSPTANFLVAGSWDSEIRCWEVQNTGGTVGKCSQKNEGPILAACWSGVRVRRVILKG